MTVEERKKMQAEYHYGISAINQTVSAMAVSNHV